MSISKPSSLTSCFSFGSCILYFAFRILHDRVEGEGWRGEGVSGEGGGVWVGEFNREGYTEDGWIGGYRIY